MGLFHTHNFVTTDGVLFCTKCGKQKKIICNHEWVVISNTSFTRIIENSIGQQSKRDYNKIVSKCTRCGEIKVDDV